MKLFNVGNHEVVLDNIGYVGDVVEDIHNYSFKISCAGEQLEITSYDEQQLIDMRDEILKELAYL